MCIHWKPYTFSKCMTLIIDVHGEPLHWDSQPLSILNGSIIIKSMELGVYRTGILSLAFPLSSCMATGKKFNLHTLASLLAKWITVGPTL